MAKKKSKNTNPSSPHPWRMCPLGQHFVATHPLTTPSGRTTTRRGHCANNPSHKDQLYFGEISEIKDKYFSNIRSGLPSDRALGFSSGKKYDLEIAAWVQYWNEVFQPKEPLDPDVVKALVASESGFKTTQITRNSGKRIGNARGLLQITDQTQKILANDDGELSDHIVNVPQNKMTDSNANICAGIRWLFYKKDMADRKWGEDASWRQAVGEYKSYTKQLIAGKDSPGMRSFDSYFTKLKVPRK